MAFTLQNNRVSMYHGSVQGPVFERFKFQLGGVYTILPPLGKTIVNAQGIDIPFEGKRLQVTKELAVLIQSGFVRIAHDIDNTGDRPVSLSASLQLSPVTESSGDPGSVDLGPESPVQPEVRDVAFSSHDLGGGTEIVSPPSTFSSVEEIKACHDHERLRSFVYKETGFPNTNTSTDILQQMAANLFRPDT